MTGENRPGKTDGLRLDSDDVLGLRALLALSQSEFYTLTFRQALEARTLNGAEVNEYVRAAFLLDETEALSVVKPFYGASYSRHNNKTL